MVSYIVTKASNYGTAVAKFLTVSIIDYRKTVSTMTLIHNEEIRYRWHKIEANRPLQ